MELRAVRSSPVYEASKSGAVLPSASLGPKEIREVTGMYDTGIREEPSALFMSVDGPKGQLAYMISQADNKEGPSKDPKLLIEGFRESPKVKVMGEEVGQGDQKSDQPSETGDYNGMYANNYKSQDKKPGYKNSVDVRAWYKIAIDHAKKKLGSKQSQFYSGQEEGTLFSAANEDDVYLGKKISQGFSKAYQLSKQAYSKILDVVTGVVAYATTQQQSYGDGSGSYSGSTLEAEIGSYNGSSSTGYEQDSSYAQRENQGIAIPEAANDDLSPLEIALATPGTTVVSLDAHRRDLEGRLDE